MTVTKIITKDSKVFYCPKGTRVLVEKIGEIATTEDIEMSEKEYHAIPATSDSAAFFE